jgi:hypothetical protein
MPVIQVKVESIFLEDDREGGRNMRRFLIPLLFLITACSVPTPLPTATSLAYTGIGLDGLSAYQATFEMRFEGDYSWVYHLETRTDGSVVAYDLHLKGVSASRNPGDVRVVVEGDIVRMRGPGTDDECLQFPSDLDLGLSFLTPDDVIGPEEIQSSQSLLKAEAVAGIEAAHYTLRQANLGGWRDLAVDLWLDDGTGAVLRYDLRADGPDPLFDAGEGALSGQFLVEVGPQTIEPVAGCEIDLPLPPDAARLVRLPDLIAFESAATSAETVAFYQAALAEAGWEPLAEPETGDDVILLSYQRDGQTLEINIGPGDEGVYVGLLLNGE